MMLVSLAASAPISVRSWVWQRSLLERPSIERAIAPIDVPSVLCDSSYCVLFGVDGALLQVLDQPLALRRRALVLASVLLGLELELGDASSPFSISMFSSFR